LAAEIQTSKANLAWQQLPPPEASEIAMAFARAATLPRADASAMARLAALTSFLAIASAIAVAAALLLAPDSCCISERTATTKTTQSV
jgi:hypothetical protein